MIKAVLLASAVMCGTILATNAMTYVAPQAPAAHGVAVLPVKQMGPPPECSEEAIRLACVKRPYASCSETYKRIHNC